MMDRLFPVKEKPKDKRVQRIVAPCGNERPGNSALRDAPKISGNLMKFRPVSLPALRCADRKYDRGASVH
ncbi:MAG: hypothetical protein ACLUD2_10930 [Clostridium sp.]